MMTGSMMRRAHVLAVVWVIAGCFDEPDRLDAEASSGSGTESTGADAPPDHDASSSDDVGSAGSDSSSSSSGGGTDLPASESTSSSDSGDSSSTGETPPWYAACTLDDECSGLDCVIDDAGSGQCSVRACESDEDCSAPPEGDGEPRCTLGQLAEGAICLLNCSGGQVCPAGSACFDTTYEGHPISGVCLPEPT